MGEKHPLSPFPIPIAHFIRIPERGLIYPLVYNPWLNL